MARIQNVFHNIVTDENTTTELLCNLLQFDDFRARFLQLTLPDVDTSEVVWDHIDTQIDHGEYGRPDIQIRNGKILALIEVKVIAGLETTENQPQGYMRYLRTQSEPIRQLVFIVPSNWWHLNQLESELQKLERRGADGIIVQTNVVTWKAVVEMIEMLGDKGNLFIEEFNQLLIGRVAPKPVVFAQEEIDMLFSNTVPSGLAHLQQVMDGLQERGSAFKIRREGSTSIWPSDYGLYYGLYFQNPQGKDAFWFGVWGRFWEEHCFPLGFGVNKKWGTEVKEAFLAAYKGDAKAFKGYTLGWIVKPAFDRPDAVSEIWSVIEPIVQATVAARR